MMTVEMKNGVYVPEMMVNMFRTLILENALDSSGDRLRVQRAAMVDATVGELSLPSTSLQAFRFTKHSSADSDEKQSSGEARSMTNSVRTMRGGCRLNSA